MWLSKGYNIVGQWLKVDLGGTYTLDHLKVWNHNENNRTSRGIQQADIYTALIDPGVNQHNKKGPFKTTGWTLQVSNQYFNQSPGGAAIAATDNAISLGGVEAAYLAIRIDSNYGTNADVGLSEIQIFVDDGGRLQTMI